MPSITETLSEDVLVGQAVEVAIPGLRQGDIIPGTRVTTIDGVSQPEARYALDLTLQRVGIQNEGPVDWTTGQELILTWEGIMIETAVRDLDTRTADSASQISDLEILTADLNTRTTSLEANLGVTNGLDASPGQIGEYLSIDNVVGLIPAVNIPTQVCVMPLPSGCWEVWGACDFTIVSAEDEATPNPTGAPVAPNQLASSISLYPDALPTQDDLILGTGVMNLIFSPLAAGQRQVLITGQCRSNSTDPITLYLVAAVGSANATVKGYVSARRVR